MNIKPLKTSIELIFLLKMCFFKIKKNIYVIWSQAKFVFEECGGLPSLELLEDHPNTDIQSQAHEIMDSYFNSEELEVA